MPRRVEDIVPANHRSIRDVKIEHLVPSHKVAHAPSRKIPYLKKEKSREGDRKEKTEDSKEIRVRKMLIEPPAPLRPKQKGSLGHWILLTLGIIIVVAGIGFVASTKFSRATFTIVPKTIPVSVNGTYVAQHLSSPAAQSSSSNLVYDTIIVKNIASTTVRASDGPTISTKAQGKFTIYNAYGNDSQQIIAGSRLANSSGKIYRLTGTVTVPGGDANNPGSIVATVVADQPGQIYNIVKGERIEDLRFLGYKGTPRYEGFYARPATDISGGFEGKKKTVSPAILASTTATLKAQLAQSLAEQAQQAVPEGYIMYDALNTTSYGEPIIGGTDPSKAEISINVVFSGIIFKIDRLATRLAGTQSIASFGKFSYTTPGLEKLTMNIANTKDFAPDKRTPLLVKVNGNFEVKGSVPVQEIKQKLAGVPLTQTQEILQSYSQIIQSASGELIPPWSKVPNDPRRISVTVKEK